MTGAPRRRSLLPPTVVLGLTAGDGHWSHAAGAALLLLANVICVNLAGVVTLLAALVAVILVAGQRR